MQLLPILLVTFLAAVSTAEPIYRFLTDDNGSVILAKRARGFRETNWGMYPVKRGRELFGKRSAPAEKRRPSELLGKRSAPADFEENEDYSTSDDYMYDEEVLRALNGLKRERRARVRELLG